MWLVFPHRIAQKSSDMFAKCRYMDEITGNRGVIFATGTPVSNSMTELYTMQRYLQYDRLQELSMTHFDCWASRSEKPSRRWNWPRREPAIGRAPDSPSFSTCRS